MAHFLAPTPLSGTPSPSNPPSPPSSSKTIQPECPLELDGYQVQESFHIVNPDLHRPSSRRRKKVNGGIGGDLVGSMKRGYKVHEVQDKRRRETRLKLLLIIAGTLFLILTTIWIFRLNNRIKSKGGLSSFWQVLVDCMIPRAQQHSQVHSSHIGSKEL